MGSVGCVGWRAEIRDSVHLPTETEPVDITSWVKSGSATFELGTTNDANLTIDCCGKGFPGLGLFTPRMRELWLWRDDDEEPSFAGPLLRRFVADDMVIGAVGRSWWWLNRRRLTALTGDVTTVARGLYEDAETQGRVGLTLDTRQTGRTYTTEAEIIGPDIESSGVRWAERGLLLQIGPQPYASSDRVFTETDWQTVPGVLIDGTDFATDTITDTASRVDTTAGVWGRSAETINDADIDGWRASRESQWSTGRGPVVLVSTGDSGDNGLTNSLRPGTEVDWRTFRPGALTNVAITTRCGDTLGTPESPVQVEIRSVTVDLSTAGAETGVAFDAQAYV